MISLVTGIGPRVGSSFVMQTCKAKGLLINGEPFLDGLLPVEGNPKGYYDLFPWDVSTLHEGVAKVWPVQLNYVQAPVLKMVILKRRDLTEQIKSCKTQMNREPVTFNITAEKIIADSKVYLKNWLSKHNKVIIKSCYTEDLDSSIDDLVNFLGD